MFWQIIIYVAIGAVLLNGCNDPQPSENELSSQQDPEPISEFEQALKARKKWSDTQMASFFANADSVNKRDKNSGNTPLLAAAFYNDVDAAKFLLARGAKVNDVHEKPDRALHGQPALWFAGALHRNSEMVQILLDAGADLRIAPRPSLSVVHEVASAGTNEILEKFLKKDSSVANWNSFIGTPLHQAANGQRVETIKLLLRYGADKTLKDSDGKTPWRWADANTRAAVAELQP